MKEYIVTFTLKDADPLNATVAAKSPEMAIAIATHYEISEQHVIQNVEVNEDHRGFERFQETRVFHSNLIEVLGDELSDEGGPLAGWLYGSGNYIFINEHGRVELLLDGEEILGSFEDLERRLYDEIVAECGPDERRE
jgi:hypothetical protein